VQQPNRIKSKKSKKKKEYISCFAWMLNIHLLHLLLCALLSFFLLFHFSLLSDHNKALEEKKKKHQKQVTEVSFSDKGQKPVNPKSDVFPGQPRGWGRDQDPILTAKKGWGHGRSVKVPE
jgi:WD40 repeat protein